MSDKWKKESVNKQYTLITQLSEIKMNNTIKWVI